ncbi:hypothetical protein [Caldivirga sp. UBA161]|nr:hypothetical protein [Caldivirga sp. UBA161]
MLYSQWRSSNIRLIRRIKLIPFDQGRLRREIKDAARKVLGRDFELY